MIERGRHRAALERLIANNPVVGLVGARQVGKATLAGEVAGRRSGPTHFFDLESSTDRARLADPLLALSSPCPRPVLATGARGAGRGPAFTGRLSHVAAIAGAHAPIDSIGSR